MLFADVRTLLRLPAPGLEAGCNLTTLSAVLNLFSGASVCLYDADEAYFLKHTGSGERFRKMFAAYYPWENETVAKDEAAKTLYRFTRNPLTHSFGLEAAKGPDLSAGKGPLSAAQIDVLEDSEARPEWVRPTLYPVEVDANKRILTVISVPTLYWGLHRTLHALLADDAQAQKAEALAKKLT